MNTRLKYLFTGYAAKQLTAEEEHELTLLLADPENEAEVKQLFEDAWESFEYTGPVFSDSKSQDILNKVMASGETDRSETHRIRRISFSVMAAAAVILMVFSMGLIFYFGNPDRKQPALAKASINDIKPGSNKAVLILADHRQVPLDGNSTGEIAKQSGIEIKKTKSGEVVYTVLDNKEATANEAISYNTLETPKGGQFQVVLPDGSKVWLNAASSLRFPTRFIGTERHVELTGEAYFEVAKNKEMPFRVTANNVAVKVLGTHFDIMAYDDEPAINTTLFEGSVIMSKAGAFKILKPGELGTASKAANTIAITPADLEKAIAWKNGYFEFKDDNIKDMMKQVARWYDVDVQFEGNMEGKNFGGKLSRYDNISDLLTNMALTSSIHYKIQGRRVLIMP